MGLSSYTRLRGNSCHLQPSACQVRLKNGRMVLRCNDLTASTSPRVTACYGCDSLGLVSIGLGNWSVAQLTSVLDGEKWPAWTFDAL